MEGEGKCSARLFDQLAIHLFNLKVPVYQKHNTKGLHIMTVVNGDYDYVMSQMP